MSKKNVRRNSAVNALLKELFKGEVKTTATHGKTVTPERIADFTHKSAVFRKPGAVPKMSGDWLVAERADGEWADLVAKPEFKTLKSEFKSASIKYGRVMVHVKDLAA